MNVIKETLKKIEIFKKNKELYMIPVRGHIGNKYCYVLRLKDHEKRRKQIKNNSRTHSWIYIYDSDICKVLGVNYNVFEKILEHVGFSFSYEVGQYALATNTNEKDIINSIYNYCIYNKKGSKI